MLDGLVLSHLTVAGIAGGSALHGTPLTMLVLVEGTRLLVNDRARFGGVAVMTVDVHSWRPPPRARSGNRDHRSGTVRAGTGPSRLLGMVEDPARQVLKTSRSWQ